MQLPAQEWQDTFRRARNAAAAWTAIAGAAVATAFLATPTMDSRLGSAIFLVLFFACTASAYGAWRLGRLIVIRHDLQLLGQPLGRVYLALVDNPLRRNIHEAVLVWVSDPRVEGKRLRRPDRRYMADLSEDDRTDDFGTPVIREAWTPVRADGTPRRGRWFYTADNLVLTVRRGGPFAWLMTARGFRNAKGPVPCEQPDMSGFLGLDRPVGFRGLPSALMLRLLGAAVLAGVGAVAF